VAGSSAKLLASSTTANAGKAPTVLELLSDRSDLSGLPVRREPDCRLRPETARVRALYSRVLRFALSGITEIKTEASREEAIARWELAAGNSPTGLRDNRSLLASEPELGKARIEEVVVPLMQVFQGEDRRLRISLVRLFSHVNDPAASAALARLAIFDLSPNVRELAVRVLPGRPRTDYRQVLLDGLRYPWSPVANHAAEALVALRDREVISRLVGILDQPDPMAVVLTKDREPTVPELVCVNHLRNCALCHAPSQDRKDPIRGLVPISGQALPTGVYYEEDRWPGPFVRADMTYLRQDFSALQPVRNHGKWPANQRHDYLIRRRQLTALEVARIRSAPKANQGQAASYPQREAVLFALRELSGMDAGTSAADWRKALARLKQQAIR
jgi:hypothetical protein